MAASTDYMLTSSVECERLERQGDLHGRHRVFDHIDLSPGMRMLDAGCGSGWVARTIAARFPEAEIVGLDLNPDYVAYAQARADAEGLRNVRFEAGDLQALRFEPGSFDLVWSQFVLYFLPDPQAALEGFRRIVRPGGKVIAALHQLPGSTWPVNHTSQPAMDAFIRAILSGFRCEAMPQMFRKAGLVDMDLEVQVDRIYSKIVGEFDPAHRRNVEEVMSGPLDRRGLLRWRAPDGQLPTLARLYGSSGHDLRLDLLSGQGNRPRQLKRETPGNTPAFLQPVRGTRAIRRSALPSCARRRCRAGGRLCRSPLPR